VPAAEPLLDYLNRTILALAPADCGQANLQTFLVNALNGVATARHNHRLATHGTMWGFSFVLGAPTPALHLLVVALVASGVLVLPLIIGLSSPFHGAVTIAPIEYAAVLAITATSGGRPAAPSQ
jgi:hypothetical protein